MKENSLLARLALWLLPVASCFLALAPAGHAQTTAALATLSTFNGTDKLSAPIQGADGNFYGTTSNGGATRNGTVYQITPGGSFSTIYSFTGGNDGFSPNIVIQGSDGNFYGTTASGGEGGDGTIFKLTPTGALTILHSFGGSDGSNPAAFIQSPGGNFFGVTTSGGANGVGTAFKITPAGTLTNLCNFNGNDGSVPTVLIVGHDSNFYGTTAIGGTAGHGTVFKLTQAGALTTVYSFTGGSDGVHPFALIQGTDNNFYGTTDQGGAGGAGTVFRLTPGGVIATLHAFSSSDGFGPVALLQGTSGNFFGVTSQGGSKNDGTIFEVTATGVLTTLHSFTGGVDGALPISLIEGTDGSLYGTTETGFSTTSDGTVLFKLTPALVLSTLHSFSFAIGSNGSSPRSLVQGTNGDFYGTTLNGGDVFNNGTAFSITPAGVLTSLHSFDLDDGAGPNSLTLARNGDFYGTTATGGSNGEGTVFKMTPAGAVSTLYDFTGGDDGYSPDAVIEGSDGNFYGTTASGGVLGYGTVFKLTPSGVITTLHSFVSSDGAGPVTLIASSGGNFYGATSGGGADNAGTIFRISSAGALATLHDFTGSDGSDPTALVEGRDGNLYGTAAFGGKNSGGSVFKLTPAGVPTVLYNFTSGNDGNDPFTLIQGKDGNFYGTTIEGGTIGGGTVFRLTPAGALTTLHSFVVIDGAEPDVLVQGSNGFFYGTNYSGNDGKENGTVYRLVVSPAITSPLAATATAGSVFTYQIAASNGPTSFKAANLPAGLSVNDATGVIAGVPAGPGTVKIALSATNAGGVGSAVLTLQVAAGPVPVITSAITATATAGEPFAYQITASNRPQRFNAANLPQGLSVNDATGVISGAPTTPGTFHIGLSATSFGSTGVASLTLTVDTQPTVLLVDPPNNLSVPATAPLTLVANVTDPSGTAKFVQFLANGSVLTTLPAAPGASYSYSYTPPASNTGTVGDLIISATVIDAFGHTNTDNHSFTVIPVPAGETVTGVEFAGGLDQHTFAAGSSITVAASPTAGNTGLTSVVFYANGQAFAAFDANGAPITSDHASGHGPAVKDAATGNTVYQAAYTLPGTGSILNLIAIAFSTDGSGQTLSLFSEPANVTVRAATQPSPAISLLNPSVTPQVGQPVTITAQPAGAASAITRMEYYVGMTKVADKSNPPEFNFAFTPDTAGVYVLSAVATDTTGLSAESQALTINVVDVPTVTIADGGDGEAVEGGEKGKVIISRTGDTSAALSVSYKAKGAAQPGVDYKMLSGNAMIPAGSAQVKIKVKPIDNTTVNGTRVVKLKLLPSTDGSYNLGAQMIAKIKIIANN